MSPESLGPAFNRLWGASLSSNFADGLMRAAAPLLAAALTREPLPIAIIGALGMLPWLLFAIPIGGLADRVDRRKLLAGANLLRAGVVFGVAGLTATGNMTIEWLYLGTFLFGIAEVVVDTSAQALIPQILTGQQLEKGNSRLQIAETIVQDFMGVPVAAVIYAAAAALPFALGGLGFGLSAVIVLLVPLAQRGHWAGPSRNDRDKFVAELKFGLKYLFRHDDLRKIVLLTTAMGFFFSASSATFVLFVLNELGVKTAQFGLLLTVIGLGSLAGAFAAPKVSSYLGRGRAMVLAITVSSGLVVAQGMAPSVLWYAAAAVLGGFLMSIWNISLMSSYQVMIPTELYGRIHGARRTLVWGMMPLGSVLGGFVAQINLRTPYLVFGAMTLALAVAGARFVRRLGDAAAAPAEVSH